MKRIVIGGPAYNMQVHAEHAATIMYCGLAFARAGWQVDTWHRHSSMLPENRDSMLRDCVTEHVDAFLSIDSDTHLDSDVLKRSLETLVEYAVNFDGDCVAWCVAAPVRQRNGVWNVVDKSGRNVDKMPPSPRTVPFDYAWCGFAFALYNVARYRDWCLTSEPLYMFGWDKPRARWIGEDSYHAMRIADKGGTVIVEPAIVTGHSV